MFYTSISFSFLLFKGRGKNTTIHFLSYLDISYDCYHEISFRSYTACIYVTNALFLLPLLLPASSHSFSNKRIRMNRIWLIEKTNSKPFTFLWAKKTKKKRRREIQYFLFLSHRVDSAKQQKGGWGRDKRDLLTSRMYERHRFRWFLFWFLNCIAFRSNDNIYR